MVTRNHNRLNASTAAKFNRFFSFGSWRVNHTNKAHKGKSVFEFIRSRILGNFVNHLVSDSKHTQCVFAHRIGDFSSLFDIALNTAGSHHIKGTLYDNNLFTADIVNGCHKLSVRIEGYFGKARIFCIKLILRHTTFVRRINNCGFSRVTNMLFAVAVKHYRAVTTKCAVHKQFLNSITIVFANILNFATVDVSLNQGHTVLGKSTCFIGADNRSTAQGFNRGELADKGIFLNHALNTD